MKKVIFALLAVCGFAAANAQLAPVTSNASISVILQDAIEITPPVGGANFSGTYATSNDYNSGVSLGSQTWNVKSTRGGLVSVSIPALSDGASHTIPASALSNTLTPSFAAGPSNSVTLTINSNVGWNASTPAGTYTGTALVSFSQQ